MLNISEEDLGALERKIQGELQKIFAEFIRDNGKGTAGSDSREPPKRKQKPKRRTLSTPAGAGPAASASKGSLRARKKFDTNRLLHGSPPSPESPPPDIIGKDMEKIFGKKHRRRPAPPAAMPR